MSGVKSDREEERGKDEEKRSVEWGKERRKGEARRRNGGTGRGGLYLTHPL